MYNTRIRFDGDIIITDPCYIMNPDNETDTNYDEMPFWYLRKG